MKTPRNRRNTSTSRVRRWNARHLGVSRSRLSLTLPKAAIDRLQAQADSDGISCQLVVLSMLMQLPVEPTTRSFASQAERAAQIFGVAYRGPKSPSGGES